MWMWWDAMMFLACLVLITLRFNVCMHFVLYYLPIWYIKWVDCPITLTTSAWMTTFSGRLFYLINACIRLPHYVLYNTGLETFYKKHWNKKVVLILMLVYFHFISLFQDKTGFYSSAFLQDVLRENFHHLNCITITTLHNGLLVMCYVPWLLFAYFYGNIGELWRRGKGSAALPFLLYDISLPSSISLELFHSLFSWNAYLFHLSFSSFFALPHIFFTVSSLNWSLNRIFFISLM